MAIPLFSRISKIARNSADLESSHGSLEYRVGADKVVFPGKEVPRTILDGVAIELDKAYRSVEKVIP